MDEISESKNENKIMLMHSIINFDFTKLFDIINKKDVIK